MPLQREAMTQENFDRSEKGLPPIIPESLERREDVMPKVKNEIALSDIPPGEIELLHAKRKSRKNSEGVTFVGYDVKIVVLKKKDPDSPDIVIDGWMIEGDFMQFVRNYRTTINQQVINW